MAISAASRCRQWSAPTIRTCSGRHMMSPGVRMRGVFLTAALLTTAAPAPSAAQHAPRAVDLAELDAYVARAVRDWRVPGLAIAVVKDDSVVFVKGYGVREVGKAGAVDAGTRFAIGSTTKAMTALALGMLVDEDKVE